MTYDEAINYIHGVSNFFCKPGLDRIKELCHLLGNPQNSLKYVHVGGTNGKGSVCSMLDSVLRSAGYKVGLYTSPYILEFNERMRINGVNISNERLAFLTEKVKVFADSMTDKPTEFELITAIAFQYFMEEKCDVVILEVGMGGKLDATNIIDPPMLSVITGIALDHTAFLGDTIEQIASEKSGIIKANSPVLYGGEDLIAKRVISEYAEQRQSKFYCTDYSKLATNSSNLNGSTLSYRNRLNVKISLLGAYQPKNAAIVLDAINVLSDSGLHIPDKAVYEGLSSARWPARFELIQSNPAVIFDGAHNPQGIAAAVDSIRLYFDNKKVVVLTGVLKDKDYLTIAKSLSSIALCAFTITPDNPRALRSEKYAEILLQNGVEATPCPSINNAVERAVNASVDNDTALVCLGSLYIYGEVLSQIKKRRRN